MRDILLVKEENPRKMLKRKRQIRRLNNELVEFNPRKRYRQCLEKYEQQIIQRRSRRQFVICILIAFFIAICVGFNIGNHDMNGTLTKIVSDYWRNYHQVVHGEHYCDEPLNSEELCHKIAADGTILNQKEALLNLQSALKYERQLTSIALIGPVGVGKTLYANALQKHFPWPQNVQSFVWNTFARSETEKYRALYMLIEKFTNCGVNLLIVKNLKSTDKELVEKVNDVIQRDHNLRQKRIILLFIFHLNTMLEEHEYLAQQQSLQNLNYTKSVNFKSFGREELKACIERELKLENVEVDQRIFQELLETIDVKHSGCKNVNSKVLAFGYQPKAVQS